MEIYWLSRDLEGLCNNKVAIRRVPAKLGMQGVFYCKEWASKPDAIVGIYDSSLRTILGMPYVRRGECIKIAYIDGRWVKVKH